MENRQHFLMKVNIKINQYISAHNEIYVRERRVSCYILFRKYAHITNELCYSAMSIVRREKSFKPVFGDFVFYTFWICSLTSFLNIFLICISAKYLDSYFCQGLFF